MLLRCIAHALHALGLPIVPRLLSEAAFFLTGIEIHPGTKIGPRLFIDHGMGVVIRETAIVGEDVVLNHRVTLGGVDSRPGRRHLRLGNGVMVGRGRRCSAP